MKSISASDTLSLPIPERIQLVEDIWDTIAAQADSVQLTSEEKQIIDKRLENYYKNPESGSPWNDVLKRLIGKNEL